MVPADKGTNRSTETFTGNFQRRIDMKIFPASLPAFLLACLIALPAWAADSVNINTASAEEIAATLSGIGLSKAQEIVRYREANGTFAHIDELVKVKGVGLKTVDRNRDKITLQVKPAKAAK
jgi:competence protein ComEA